MAVGNPFADLPLAGEDQVQNAPIGGAAAQNVMPGTTIVPGTAERYPDIPSSVGLSARQPMPGTLVFGQDINPALPRTPTSMFETLGVPALGVGVGGGFEALGKGLQQFGENRVPAEFEKSDIFAGTPSRLGRVRDASPNTQAVGRAIGDAASSTGQSISDYGKGVREAQPQSTVPTYQEIYVEGQPGQTARNLGTYIWESALQAAGSTVPMLAAGAVTGPVGALGAGWTMGVGQMRRSVEDERVKIDKAAQAAMQSGNVAEAERLAQIASRLDPKTQAQLIYAAGSVIGLLDSLFPASMFVKSAQTEAVKKLTAEYVTKSLTTAALSGMAKEGTTETLQQATEVLAIAKAKGAQAALEYLQALNDNRVEIIDAGLRGGFGGSAISGVGKAGSLVGERDRGQSPPTPEASNQPQERQEPQLSWPLAQNVETPPAVTPEAQAAAETAPPATRGRRKAAEPAVPANPFADLVPANQNEQAPPTPEWVTAVADAYAQGQADPAVSPQALLSDKAIVSPLETGQSTGQAPKESITLYRGEAPGAENDPMRPARSGQNWTDTLENAQAYAGEGGKVFAVTVPADRAGELQRSTVREDEVRIPADLQDRSQWQQVPAQAVKQPDTSGNEIAPGIYATPTTSKIDDRTRYEITNANGDVIGSATVGDSQGRFSVKDVRIAPQYQRQGVATAMYDRIERDFGRKLQEDNSQTNASRAFWDKRSGRQQPTAKPMQVVTPDGSMEIEAVPQVVELADLSNRTAIAQMSATERAMRDAQAMGLDGIALYEGGNFDAPQNQRFMRDFMTRAVTAAEMPSVSREGQLTMEGVARMRAAVLAAAYGDADVLARMLESTDDNVRSITAGLLDAAPRMAQLRAGIASGEVDPDMDPVPALMDSVRTISDLRTRKVSVQQWLAQSDAFGRDPIVEAWVKSFYYDDSNRAKRQEKVALLLNDYAAEAVLHRPGGLFADETTTADVLNVARRKNDASEADIAAPTGPMGEDVPKGRARKGRRQDGASGERTAESDDILAAIQSAPPRIEYEARAILKDARDYEDYLVAEGASPQQIAAAFNARYGSAVTPDQIESGNVWWRRMPGEREVNYDSSLSNEYGILSPGAASELVEQILSDSPLVEGVAAPMDVDARPAAPQQAKGVAGGASPGPRLSADQRNTAVALAQQGMNSRQIASELQKQSGAYVRSDLVDAAIASAKATADKSKASERTAAKRRAYYDSPEFREASAARMREIMARPEMQAWASERGRQLAESKGQTVWTPAMVERLGDPKLRTVPASQVAKQFNDAFGTRLTENAIRQKRSDLGYRYEGKTGVDPKKFRWDDASDVALASVMQSAPNFEARALLLNKQLGVSVSPKAVQRRWDKIKSSVLRSQGEEPMFAAGGLDAASWLDWIKGKPDGQQDPREIRGAGKDESGIATGQQPGADGDRGDGTRNDDGGRAPGGYGSFQVGSDPRKLMGRVVDTTTNAQGLRTVDFEIRTWANQGKRSPASQIAKAQISETAPDQWELIELRVRSDERRSGIGSDVLDAVERHIGSQIPPPQIMTPQLYGMWRKRERQGSIIETSEIGDYERFKNEYRSPENLRTYQKQVQWVYDNATDKIDKNNAKKELEALDPIIRRLDDKLPPEDDILAAIQGTNPSLDLSPEARKERAEDMGFDTSTTWYRGVSGMHALRPYSMWTTSPGEASAYSQGVALTNTGDNANVMPAYMKRGNGRNIDPEIEEALFETEEDPDVVAKDIIDSEGLDWVEFHHPSVSQDDDHVVRVIKNPSSARSVNATFNPSQEASADLMAAVNAEPKRNPAAFALMALTRLKRPVVVPKNVVNGILEALQPSMGMVPEGVNVGVLERVAPFKGEGKADSLLTFRLTDGELLEIPAVAADVLTARAFTMPASGFIGFNRFDLSGDPSRSLRGEVGHEVVHILRRQNAIEAADWSRLVAQGNALSLLDSDYRTHLQRVGNPNYSTVAPGRTGRQVYDERYGKSRNKAEYMDQEAVAHMVELYAHNELLPQEVEGIKPILDAILDGSIWKVPQAESSQSSQGELELMGAEQGSGSIPSELQPLAEHARKFKSAHDFMRHTSVISPEMRALDKLAFGVEDGEELSVDPKKLHVVYKDDLENAKAEKQIPYGADAPPIDVSIRKIGNKIRWVVDDGHHRYWAALRDKKPVKIKIDSIQANTFKALGFDGFDEFMKDFYEKATGAAQGSEAGLDVSPEARKARAEAEGFDTSKVLYHGTSSAFDEFKGNRSGIVYLTDNPEIAAIYSDVRSGESGKKWAAATGRTVNAGPNIMPVYIKRQNPLVVSDKGPDGSHGWLVDNLERALGVDSNTRGGQWKYRALFDEARQRGHDVVEVRDMSDLGGEQTQYMVLDPANIRSVNAAFDPDRTGDPNLLAAIQRNRLRDQDSLGYYSRLDEVLESLGPKDKVTSATLQQKGVKLAEIEARGLMPLFDKAKGSRPEPGALNPEAAATGASQVLAETPAYKQAEAAAVKAYERDLIENRHRYFETEYDDDGNSLPLDPSEFPSIFRSTAFDIIPAIAAAVEAGAQSLGFNLDLGKSVTSASRYGTIDVNGRKRKVRVSDHERQSGLHDGADYNIAPGGLTPFAFFERLITDNKPKKKSDSGAVPVSDLLDVAGKNKVELRENQRFVDPKKAERDRLRAEYQAQRRLPRDQQNPQLMAELESRIDDMMDEFAEDKEKYEPKWQSYSLDPSNPTYRETVIHLPPKAKPITYKEWLAANDYPDIPEMRANFEQFGATDSTSRAIKTSQGDFHSGHFPEPNIIGHMMTSMTTHEGKPVFTIDQIQSDWGQKLRDGGVRDEGKIKEMARALDGARAAQKSAFDDANEFVSIHLGKREPTQDFIKLSVALNHVNDRPLKSWEDWNGAPKFYTDDVRAQAQELQRKINPGEVDRLQAELRTAEAATPGNPLVNTTDQWTNTTLRRAIRMAAEADAEYIAIPSGDTVLSYNPGDNDGMEGFYGAMPNPKGAASLRKEIADVEAGRNTNLDLDYLKKRLAIAENGMTGIVPKNLRNILTKLDKASPPPQRIETLDSPSGKTGLGQGFTLFPLTDRVKQEVLDEGQPLFAFGGVQSPGADVSAYADAVVMNRRGASPKEILDATGWYKDKSGKWKFWNEDEPAEPQTVADARTHVRRMEMTPEERKATPPWKEPAPAKPATRSSGGSVTVDRSFIDRALDLARRAKKH